MTEDAFGSASACAQKKECSAWSSPRAKAYAPPRDVTTRWIHALHFRDLYRQKLAYVRGYLAATGADRLQEYEVSQLPGLEDEAETEPLVSGEASSKPPTSKQPSSGYIAKKLSATAEGAHGLLDKGLHKVSSLEDKAKRAFRA